MIRVPDKTRTYVLEAILGLALVVAPGVAAGAAMDSAHGNIAEWIAALATALAFVAAFFAAQYTKQAYEIEQAREGRALDAIEREQASKVAAWINFTVLEGRDRSVHPKDVNIFVRNASDVPVTGVSVRFYLVQWRGDELEDERDLGWIAVHLIPPNPEPHMMQLPPDARAALVKFWNTTPGLSRDLRVRIRFVDAAGTPWQRHPDGELEKLTWDADRSAGSPDAVKAAALPPSQSEGPEHHA